MIKQFLNRTNELETLNSRHNSDRAEFTVIYGRRRIGKSRLIDEFIEDKKGVRLLAREESEKMTLERFSSDLAEIFEDETLAQTTLPDWDSFFEYLAGKTEDDRYIIAIDEFPYIVEQNRSFPSILQDHWDSSLSNTRIFLMICGSAVSAMEDIMGHESPLYGRRTSQLLLKPISFTDIFKEIDIDIEKVIKFYSVFGGTPPYFIEADLNETLEHNLIQKVFQYDSFLLQDTEFVLRNELKKPHFYFSILTAIAEGKTKVNKIVNHTGVERSKVGRYLSILRDLKLVEREVPVTEEKTKSRRGIYKLSDNFFKFWFNFINPNQMLLERGKSKELADKVMEKLPRYIGPLFEDICREFVWDDYDYHEVGRWWYKENEIDIVGLKPDENKILFGECKWSEDVDPESLYYNLKEKKDEVRWNSQNREEEFVLFAKSFQNDFTADDLDLFDLERMERSMK